VLRHLDFLIQKFFFLQSSNNRNKKKLVKIDAPQSEQAKENIGLQTWMWVNRPELCVLRINVRLDLMLVAHSN